MWLAGAIGMACGGGFYFIAVIASVIAVVILSIVKWFEVRVLQSDDGPKAADGDAQS